VASLKLQNIGLALDEWGWIKTDKFMKTNLKNVYACGDINGKKFFAYTAEYQAEICINNIAGNKMEEDYTGIPECVFSLPQIAKVGILEEEAKKKNMKYKIANSNFLKFSSSYLHDDVNGFIEIVADEEDRVIGAGIISNMASELISIFSLAIKNNLTLKDLKKCTLIHPTLSEIIPLILKN
jgi:dihydrolipoamide dehydrogenase